jgi:hypothetical protein
MIEASLCCMQCPLLFKRCGQSTDSGGGGVLGGLAREMAKQGLCLLIYLVANCCMHNLQLQLLVPTKTVLGNGGLEKRSTMQLLHSIGNLQRCFETYKFQSSWQVANDFANSNILQDNDGNKGSEGNEDFANAWKLVQKCNFQPFLS